MISRLPLLMILLVALAQSAEAQAPQNSTGSFLQTDDFRQQAAHQPVPSLAGVATPAPTRTVTTEAAHAPQRISPPDAIANPNAKQDSAKTSPGASLSTIVALSTVVVVILLVGRVWKKHGGLGSPTAPVEAIELLGKRYVDPRQTIHLVRLGTRILVIGSTPGGLQSLAEVTDPVEVDYLAGLCRPSQSDGSVAKTFRSLLSSHSRQGNAPSAYGASSAQKLEQLRAGGRRTASDRMEGARG